MKSNVKISIVIPVFNAAPYLPRLLDSLLRQSYRDWEALFVDDGSNDGSLDILKRAADEDARVCYFSIVHQGSSGARNKALENATGDLIAFIDADDFVHPDMLAIAAHRMSESSADAVMFDFEAVEPGTGFSFSPLLDSPSWQRIDDMIGWALIPWHPFAHGLWHTIYRRYVLEGLRFFPKIKHQDLLFSYQAFGRVKRLDYLRHVLYAYVQTPNSVIRSGYSKDKVDSTVTIIKTLDAYYAGNKRVRKLLRRRLYPRLVSNMWKLSDKSGNSEMCEEVKQATVSLWSSGYIGLRGFSFGKKLRLVRKVFL